MKGVQDLVTITNYMEALDELRAVRMLGERTKKRG